MIDGLSSPSTYVRGAFFVTTPMSIHDPRHPLWSFLRLMVVLVSLTLILVVQASEFDNTELNTIGLMFVTMATYEGAGFVWQKFKAVILKMADEENDS